MSSASVIASHRFGTYELVRKLGEGGMAEVFLGVTTDEKGALLPAAIKIAKPVEVAGIDVDELFAGEADLMKLLRHHGIVSFYEVGRHSGRFYIAMEHLSGGDMAGVLSALRKRGRVFPAGIAAAIVLRILSPLAFVHGACGDSGTPLKLIHGDVNPGNIFFDAETGRIKLGDFGVAVSQTLDVGLPPGMAGGKLSYLSPEQAGGGPLTAATDLFALSVVLYEFLFGHRPFEGGSPEEIMEKIAQCRFNEDVEMAPWADDFFHRAFSRRERDRFQTAGEMASVLIKVLLDDLSEPSDEEICRFLNAALDER